MKKPPRKFLIYLAIFLNFAIGMTIIGTLLYVIGHFIIKFW
jgi:hypothetical protein